MSAEPPFGELMRKTIPYGVSGAGISNVRLYVKPPDVPLLTPWGAAWALAAAFALGFWKGWTK